MAYNEGLAAVGSVDFDVLDAVTEMLESGRILGIRTVAGIETRVFVKEMASKVINSPGEPGVFYFMGTGFYKEPLEGSKSSLLLKKFAGIARERNIARLAGVNRDLKEVALDYEGDVLPLTPKGNATERHILAALINKSEKIFIASKAVDFRFGIDGLCELIVEDMKQSPSSGLYLFYNKSFNNKK